jgi:predicted MFS family arabinose efflux permease
MPSSNDQQLGSDRPNGTIKASRARQATWIAVVLACALLPWIARFIYSGTDASEYLCDRNMCGMGASFSSFMSWMLALFGVAFAVVAVRNSKRMVDDDRRSLVFLTVLMCMTFAALFSSAADSFAAQDQRRSEMVAPSNQSRPAR